MPDKDTPDKTYTTTHKVSQKQTNKPKLPNPTQTHIAQMHNKTRIHIDNKICDQQSQKHYTTVHNTVEYMSENTNIDNNYTQI